MCTEIYAEFHKLIQQYVSSIGVGKIKCETLNELFAALSRLGIKDKKTNILIKSVLSTPSRRNRIGYSSMREVYKYLKSLKKNTNDNFIPPCEIYDQQNQSNVLNSNTAISPRNEKNFKFTYHLRSSHQQPRNRLLISTSDETTYRFGDVTPDDLKVCVPKSVPKIYPPTQGRTSKSKFLEYFDLGNNARAYCPKPLDATSSFSVSMFNNSANVPFSSELGLLLAERVQHSVSEDFKLRKIQRLERYINKPHTSRDENINYPITYVDKNPNTRTDNCHVKAHKKLSEERISSSIKSLSVLVENVNLVQLQKKIHQLAKKRKRDRLYRLKKKCRELKVVLRPSDKKNIAKMIRAKRRK